MRWAAPTRPALAGLVLAAFVVLVLFAGLASKQVHGTAALYASLARSIADSGDPLGVFTGPEAYLLKPPLLIWLTAAAVELLGPTSAAATLATRASGVLLVLLTFLLARRLFGFTAAWCAALVLATNSTFHQFSTSVRMDALLMCGVLMAVLGYFHGARRWAPWLLFGGLAVAVLAKGPPGLLPLLLLPLHWLVARPPLAAGRYWLAAASLLLLPLAWYAFLIDANGARVWEELAADVNRGHRISLAEQLASAADAYLLKPLRRWWPGLPFMIAGLVLAAMQLRRAGREARAGAVLLLAWVAIVALVSAAKPDHDIRYLFMALPALAVLAGAAAARLLPAGPPNWLTAAVAVLAMAVLPAAGWLEPDDRGEMQRIRGYLDARLGAGEAVTVIGSWGNYDPGPRRQHTEVDWTHYYLGRPARMHDARQAAHADIDGVPFVLVSRYVRSAELLRRLGLEPLIRAEEITLAVPREVE